MSKYEKALKRARKYYKETTNSIYNYKDMLEQIFPDIEESEDKKIKEEIVNYFQCQSRDEPCRKHIHDKWIAWLEKQAEQKPTLRERYKNIAESEWFKKTHEGISVSNDEKVDNINKIEPKFNVGDYIERKDGLGCHAKIIFVGGNVYGCEKIIYSEDSFPFFELMFENQDEFKISSDFQQKPAWSEKDGEMIDETLYFIREYQQSNRCKDENGMQNSVTCEKWLHSLKERIRGEL